MVEGARDLSDYFAKRTCNHVHNRVGSSRWEKKGLFEEHGNCVEIWGGCRIRFVDDRKHLRIYIDSNEGGLEEVASRLKNIKAGDGDGVVSSVSLVREDGLYVDVEFVPHSNSYGRASNQEKLFHAVYRNAVKPVLSAVYTAHGSRG